MLLVAVFADHSRELIRGNTLCIAFLYVFFYLSTFSLSCAQEAMVDKTPLVIHTNKGNVRFVMLRLPARLNRKCMVCDVQA